MLILLGNMYRFQLVCIFSLKFVKKKGDRNSNLGQIKTIDIFCELLEKPFKENQVRTVYLFFPLASAFHNFNV